MEAIQDIRAPQLFGERTAMTPSKQRSLSATDALELGRLLVRMRANCPNQELSAETAALWLEDWEEIALTAGMGMLTVALEAHRKSSSFLPSRADIEKQIEKQIAILRERKIEERRVALQKAGYDEHQAYIARCRREQAELPPSERFSLGLLAAEVKKRLGVKVEETAQKRRERLLAAIGARERTTCAHCEFWELMSPQDLREVANRREQEYFARAAAIESVLA